MDKPPLISIGFNKSDRFISSLYACDWIEQAALTNGRHHR